MGEEGHAPLHPFPGLRPFRSDEDYLFFGREEQVTELLGRLQSGRFLAVVGSSGSGKSSLVRCGILSELQAGSMVGAGSFWEIAVLQPGGDPIGNLARALCEADLYDPEDPEALPNLRATLMRSRLGLVEAARQSAMEKDSNLLVVVDQFEEIFRFHEAGRKGEEQAPDFVQLLLEAARQEEIPIYVMITMRSDFLGDCAQFADLAEAVNQGEYLIPRLSRDQSQSAIEGPVRVAGGTISRRLVQRLLNDLGDDPDQLPILQHALMRTWDCWLGDHEKDEPVDLRHYEAVGCMAEALSRHADEVFTGLPTERHREVARRVFKALTEKE
ncbi:MAG: hypothetical protein GWO24_32240, partial [Akkermansiaceae bacterium]|nr:hypothetical protein [Akkermansiaceae bacterium]